MKTAIKIGLLLTTGLLTAGVVYPLLHEMGHAVVALCAGAHVEEMRLLPTASILCHTPATPSGLVAMGLGGILLPPLVAVLLPHRRFWSWFVRYILLTVCLMSLVFSLIALGCWQSGHPLPQEDVTQILRYTPQSLPLCYAVLTVALAVVALPWLRSHPLSRWTAFLCG